MNRIQEHDNLTSDDISRLVDELQQSMMRSMMHHETSKGSNLHPHPIPTEITIETPIAEGESLIELKVKNAELQTQLEVELNRANKKEIIAASLLEEKLSYKREISAFQDEVFELEKDCNEMVSSIVLLICKLDQMKQSSATTSSDVCPINVSEKLRDRIDQAMSAVAVTSKEVAKKATTGGYRYQKRSSMPSKENEELPPLPAPKKHSSDPNLREARRANRRGDLSSSAPAPALRSMLRRFGSSLGSSFTLSRPPALADTSLSPSKANDKPVVSLEQPKIMPHSSSLSNLLQKKYAEEDLDESLRYLSSQNTVRFPGETSSEEDDDQMLGPMGLVLKEIPRQQSSIVKDKLLSKESEKTLDLSCSDPSLLQDVHVSYVGDGVDAGDDGHADDFVSATDVEATKFRMRSLS